MRNAALGAASAVPATSSAAAVSTGPAVVPAGRTPDGRPASHPAGHVLLVASNGGHLAQLLALRPWLADRRRSWVTFRKEDAVSQLAGEQVSWAYHPTTRNIPNLLRNFALAAAVLRRDRPDAIVSTGAAVAFPFFVLGRLLGIATVYIEVYDRIDSPTLTGRLCRPFADVFCVQWPEQQAFYPGSRVVGPLL